MMHLCLRSAESPCQGTNEQCCAGIQNIMVPSSAASRVSGLQIVEIMYVLYSNYEQNVHK